jgi:hypothetical protein
MSHALSNASLRRHHWLPVSFAFLLLASSEQADAYGVLTHQQLIDQSWTAITVPVLLSRYPSLSPEQLRRAHAYAYGGCAIQDLGYYPFGNSFFSDLTHYVRSGDFVWSLFRNAHSADELAFAIGALTHYLGDSIGHSEATNPAVAIEFPKLAARYGPSVDFARGKIEHNRVEFAFDIYQLANRHLAPSEYLHYIGLEAPRQQLLAAFRDTYGFELRDILGLYRTALRTYRFGARSFLPAFARAEALLHRRRFPPDAPGPELALYERRVAELAREAEWARLRKKPGIGTHLLAVLVVIVPKIGPIKMLAIKGPTVETRKSYLDSVNNCTAALALVLGQLAAPGGGTLHAALLPNRDLDTGAPVVPGGYPLTDQTYAKLLGRITKDPMKVVPDGLKQDILRYYADPASPISTKRNPKKWARIEEQLQRLSTMPTRAEQD